MHLPTRPSTLSVAVLGTLGSYHHQVAVALFPHARIHYCATFGDIVAAVCEGETQKGIVAVANSTIGILPAPQAAMESHARELRTEREYVLPITHGLVVADPSVNIETITTVVSHTAALQQCCHTIQAYRWQTRAAMDTATAVQEVMAQGNPALAAIASPFAARLYGAHLLPISIQDNVGNATTFAVIKRDVHSS